MCIMHLQIVFQPLAPLTYGCQKVCMMCFVVVVNFLSSKWEAKHITIRLFEVFDTSGALMVLRL